MVRRGGHIGGVWTQLELWLIRQGIIVSHSRRHHPQTQGKDERFHRTLKAELLTKRYFSSLPVIQEALDEWRETYNTQWPHDGIGLSVPSSRYRTSECAYNPVPKAAEYRSDMQTRKVDINGRLTLKGKEYHVGKAFIKERLGIEE